MLSAEPLKQSEVLELDRKIREFPEWKTPEAFDVDGAQGSPRKVILALLPTIILIWLFAPTRLLPKV